MMKFETFNEQIAAALKDSPHLTGLPSYLGIETVDVSAGRMVVRIAARPELHNPFGSLHGGVLAALVDHVLGAVLYPVIPAGCWAATTEFKLNYIAPVREGSVEAESVILNMTRRTAVVRVEVTNDGRLVCAAQGTVLIVEPKA